MNECQRAWLGKKTWFFSEIGKSCRQREGEREKEGGCGREENNSISDHKSSITPLCCCSGSIPAPDFTKQQ